MTRIGWSSSGRGSEGIGEELEVGGDVCTVELGVFEWVTVVGDVEPVALVIIIFVLLLVILFDFGHGGYGRDSNDFALELG